MNNCIGKIKPMRSTASFNIKLEKKIKIERLAMEIGMKIGRPVKWTEVMNVLVDQFAKDAVAYIEHNENTKQTKNNNL